MKATKENLISELKRIGWSVRNHGADYDFIYNHKGKCTFWVIKGDRVTLNDHIGSFDETPTCEFYFKSCFIERLNPGKKKQAETVCLTARGCGKAVYIFFANYDLNKEDDHD